MGYFGVKLSTLEAAVAALLSVNNVWVRRPDATDEEIRQANHREWTEKDEAVLQQWRELQRVFAAIRQAKGRFPQVPGHTYQRPKLLGTWITVNK
jgi:hypothetical protein